MNRPSVFLTLCLLLMSCTVPLLAQHAAGADGVVPRLVNFSGKVADAQGKPLPGITGITFAIYKDQEGGAPLWMETQNVKPDKAGHYTVQLGASKPAGLPMELFTSGEARWLGVQVSGAAEQPRTLLLSVPYAFKAMDAETLGGKPLTSFMLAPPSGKNAGSRAAAAEQANEIVCSSGAGCKTGFVPLFSSNGGSAKVTNSIIKQSGTTVSVAGAENVSGNINSSNSITASGSVNATGLSVSGNASVLGSVAAANVSTTFVSSVNPSGNGLYGVSRLATQAGVYGQNTASGGGFGLYGYIGAAATGQGVWGESLGTTASNGAGPDGVHGVTHTNQGSGVAGLNTDPAGVGVYGSASGYGVYGISGNAGGSGVGAINDAGGDGIYAEAVNGGFAGWFQGNANVNGNLSKAAGSFKIDHPLDPANKYLYHSFVESPDMMNIYNGTVITDAQGNSTVNMPDWFEALNRDFRYQLTVIGQFAQAIVASKMANHTFTIKTDKPKVEVCWQVTGVRHDAWADAHRIPVEQAKTGRERGMYLHPELFGAPPEKSVAAVHHQIVKLARESAQHRSPIN